MTEQLSLHFTSGVDLVIDGTLGACLRSRYWGHLCMKNGHYYIERILERTMLYLALLQGEILNISQTGIYSATYYFFGCRVFALKLCALPSITRDKSR